MHHSRKFNNISADALRCANLNIFRNLKCILSVGVTGIFVFCMFLPLLNASSPVYDLKWFQEFNTDVNVDCAHFIQFFKSQENESVAIQELKKNTIYKNVFNDLLKTCPTAIDELSRIYFLKFEEPENSIHVTLLGEFVGKSDPNSLQNVVKMSAGYFVNLVEKRPSLFFQMENVYILNLATLFSKEPIRMYQVMKSLEFNDELKSIFNFRELFDTKNMALSLADEYIQNMIIDGKEMEGSLLHLTTKFFIAQISELIEAFTNNFSAGTLAKLTGVRQRLLKANILCGNELHRKIHFSPPVLSLLEQMLPNGAGNDSLLIPLSIQFEEGGHAMLLEVKLKSEKLLDLIIFNTGDGIQRHFSKYSEIQKIIPYLWYQDVPVDLFISSYLAQVLPSFQGLKLTPISLYDGLLGIFSNYQVDIQNYKALEKYSRAQISGSCSMSVLKAYLLYYLDESEYAEVLAASDFLSLKEIDLKKDTFSPSYTFLVSSILETISRNFVKTCQGTDLYNAEYDTIEPEKLKKLINDCLSSFVGKLAIEAYPIIVSIKNSLKQLPLTSVMQVADSKFDSLSENIVLEVNSVLEKYKHYQNLSWQPHGVSRSLELDSISTYYNFSPVPNLSFKDQLQKIRSSIKKSKEFKNYFYTKSNLSSDQTNSEYKEISEADSFWNLDFSGVTMMFKFYNVVNLLRTILPLNVSNLTSSVSSSAEALEVLTSLDLISEALGKAQYHQDFDQVDLQSHLLLLGWLYHKRYLELYNSEHKEVAKKLLDYCLPFGYYKVFSQRQAPYYVYKNDVQLRNILGPIFEGFKCENEVFEAKNYEENFPKPNSRDFQLFELLRNVVNSTNIVKKQAPQCPTKSMRECEDHFIFELDIGSSLTDSLKLVRNIYFRILGRLASHPDPVQHNMSLNFSQSKFEYYVTFQLVIPASILSNPDSQNLDRINSSNDSLFTKDLKTHEFLAFYTLTKRLQVDKTLLLDEEILKVLEWSVSSVFLSEISVSDVEVFFIFFETEFYSFMEKVRQEESNQDLQIATNLAQICAYIFKFLSEQEDLFLASQFKTNFIEYAISIPSEKLDRKLLLDLAMIICEDDIDYLFLFKILSIMNGFRGHYNRFTTLSAHDANRALAKALTKQPSGPIRTDRIQDTLSRYFQVELISCEYDSTRASIRCSNPNLFVALLQDEVYLNDQYYYTPSNSLLEQIFSSKKQTFQTSWIAKNGNSNVIKQIYKIKDVEGAFEVVDYVFVVWRHPDESVQIISKNNNLSKIVWFLKDILYVSLDGSMKIGNYHFDCQGFESGYEYLSYISTDGMSSFAVDNEMIFKRGKESILVYTKTKFYNTTLQFTLKDKKYYLNNEIFVDPIENLNFPLEVPKLTLLSTIGKRYILIPSLSVSRTVALVELTEQDQSWIPAASTNYECFLLTLYNLKYRYYVSASDLLDQVDHMYALTPSDIEIMDAITAGFESSSDSTPNKYVLLGKLLIISYKNYRLHPKNQKWSPKNAFKIISMLLNLKHSVKAKDMILKEFSDKYILQDFLHFHIEELLPSFVYWLEENNSSFKDSPISALLYTDYKNYMKIDVYASDSTRYYDSNITDLIDFFKDKKKENIEPFNYVQSLIEEPSGLRLSALRDLMLVNLTQGKTSKYSAALFFLPIILKAGKYGNMSFVEELKKICQRQKPGDYGRYYTVYEKTSYPLHEHLRILKSHFSSPRQMVPKLTFDTKWSISERPAYLSSETFDLNDFHLEDASIAEDASIMLKESVFVRKIKSPLEIKYFIGNFDKTFYKARHQDVLASWNSNQSKVLSTYVFENKEQSLEILKNVKDRAAQYIKSVEPLIDDFKRKVADLLDDKLAKEVENYSAIFRLSDFGYESRVKDLKKLNHCVARNDIFCIRKLAKISTSDQAIQLRNAILQFTFYSSISKYLEKHIVKFIESGLKEANSTEEIENIVNFVGLRFSKLIKERKYLKDTMKLKLDRSSMLLFEDYGSLILKNSQIQDILNGTEYIEGTHKFKPNVNQRMMASGKTFVLATFFAFYKADGYNLSVIIQPTSLAYDNFASLSKRSLSAFGQSSFVLWYDRSPDKFTVNYLQYIKYHLIDAINTRKYVMMTIESCQALSNRYLDALESNLSLGKKDFQEEISLLKDILLIFKTRAIATVDEIDMVLNPTKELNFPTRKRDKIDPLLAKLLTALFKHIALDKKFADLGLNLMFPSQVTVTEENWKKISELMVNHLMEEIWPSHGNGSEYYSFLKLRNVKSPEAFIGELKVFLLSDQVPQSWWIKEYLDNFEDKAEFVLVLRKQVQEWLIFAFKKVNNQHFGRSLKDLDYKLAKPYAAANSPNERSIFSDKLETFNKTLQMYLAQGLDESQVALLLVKLKKEARFQALTVKDNNIAATKIGETCSTLFNGNIEFLFMTESEIKVNAQKYQSLFEESKKSLKTRQLYVDVMLDYVLATVIIPAEFFVEQISASSFDFCHMFSTVSGYSGTISNKNVLPHSVLVKENEYFKPDIRSDGRIMRLLVSQNPYVGVIEDINQKDDFTATFERFISNEVWTKTPKWKQNLSALIDSGALLKQFSNEMVAKGLSKYFKDSKDLMKTHVLYYNSDDQEIYCMSVNTLEKRKLKPCNEAQILSVCGAKLSQIFMYYDQYHTTGSDVPFSGTATAILTVDSSTNLRDILQGGMRMRKLFDYQHLVMFVEKKLASFIEEKVTPVLGSDEKYSLSVNSILLFSELIGFDQELVENVRIAFLKIFSAYKNFLISKMYASDKEAEIYAAFRDKFFIRNVKYDLRAWVAPTKAVDAKEVLRVYAKNLRSSVVEGLQKILNADFSSELPDHESIINISVKTLPEKLSISDISECNLGVSAENEVNQEQSVKTLVEVVNEATVDSFLTKYEPIEQTLWPKLALSELSQNIISNSVDSIPLNSLNSLLAKDSSLSRFSNLFSEKILFSDNFYKTATVTDSVLHLFGRFSKLAYFVLFVKNQDDYRLVLLSLGEAKYFFRLLKANSEQQEMRLFYLDDSGVAVSPSNETVSIPASNLVELLLLGSQYEIVGKHEEVFLQWLSGNNSDFKVTFLTKYLSQGVYHERYVNSHIQTLVNQFNLEEADSMELLERALTNGDSTHCLKIVDEIPAKELDVEKLKLLSITAFSRGATEAVGQAILTKLLKNGLILEPVFSESLLKSIRSAYSFNYLKRLLDKDFMSSCKKYSNFKNPKNPDLLGLFVECLQLNYLNYSDTSMLSILEIQVWGTITYIMKHFDAGNDEDLWQKMQDLVKTLVRTDNYMRDQDGYWKFIKMDKSSFHTRWQPIIKTVSNLGGKNYIY